MGFSWAGRRIHDQSGELWSLGVLISRLCGLRVWGSFLNRGAQEHLGLAQIPGGTWVHAAASPPPHSALPRKEIQECRGGAALLLRKLGRNNLREPCRAQLL